jgi:hypothetical protein
VDEQFLTVLAVDDEALLRWSLAGVCTAAGTRSSKRRAAARDAIAGASDLIDARCSTTACLIRTTGSASTQSGDACPRVRW